MSLNSTILRIASGFFFFFTNKCLVYELVQAAMGARLGLKLASQSAAQTSLGTILGQDLEVAGVFQKA